LVDSSKIPTIQIENLDKWIHSFFHFVFTLVWFLFFKKQFQSNNNIVKSLLFAFFFSFCFGILIEFLQQLYTTTRKGDVLDVIANTFGALLGILTIVIGNRLSLFDRILKS
jgi:VanZ family protein